MEKERKGINKHEGWKNYINIARIMNRKCEKNYNNRRKRKTKLSKDGVTKEVMIKMARE